MLEKIRGLSLTRPWPWAFVNGPKALQKRIENRSWPCPSYCLQRVQIALHAAKSWNEDDRDWISEALGIECPPKTEHLDSVIFAVCRVEKNVTDELNIRPIQQAQWFFGPYGWTLTHFVKLIEPVECKGAQGLWTFEKKQAELEKLKEVYAASKGSIDI